MDAFQVPTEVREHRPCAGKGCPTCHHAGVMRVPVDRDSAEEVLRASRREAEIVEQVQADAERHRISILAARLKRKGVSRDKWPPDALAFQRAKDAVRQKRVSFSINGRIGALARRHCRERGIPVARWIESLIEAETGPA